MVHELDQYVESFSLVLRQVKLRGVAGQCLHRTIKKAKNVKTDMDGCLYSNAMPELEVRPRSPTGLKGGLQSPRKRSLRELEKAQWENTDIFTLDLAQWRDRSALEHLILHEREALQNGGKSWKTVHLNEVQIFDDGKPVVFHCREDDDSGEQQLDIHCDEVDLYRKVIEPIIKGVGPVTLSEVPDQGSIQIEAAPLLWGVG